MGLGGKVEIALLAVLAALALPSAAAASTTLTVNDEVDAPLESGESECKSTDPQPQNCTLLAAVELANTVSLEEGGATVKIDVPAGNYDHTLPASVGILYVEAGASVEVDGAGAGKTIIDGGGVTDLFEVEEEGTLKVDGVTVQDGGSEDEGGGFYVAEDGALTVEDSTVQENQANDDGGGISRQVLLVHHGQSLDDHAQPGSVRRGDLHRIRRIGRNRRLHDHRKHGRKRGRRCVRRTDRRRRVRPRQDSSKARAKAAISFEEGGAELQVEQSTIDGNTASLGGGIYAFQDNTECPGISHAGHASARAGAHAGASTAHPALIGFDAANLAIEQSTIAYNRAEENDREGGYGGGIYEEGSFFDPIVNSTIADNFATNDGGGIAAAGGDFDALINDTVFNNTVEPETPSTAAKRLGRDGNSAGKLAHAAVQGIAQGGPGSNLATEVENGSGIGLRNTIVAEPKGQENCEGEIFPLLEGGGYNLDYPSNSLPEEALDTCGLEEEHNLRGVNPQLEEELKNNGGPTQTLALQAGSPAIGFVSMAEDCEEPESGDGPAMLGEHGEVLAPVDQRGVGRPGLPGRGCDIGAYEYQAPPAVTPPATPTTTTTSVLPFKITISPQCASKRDITIHIQNVKRLGIVSAVISIDGHSKKTLTGKRLTAAIDLRGLPTGTFTVKIVARRRDGRKLTGKRVYHTCHSKLPGHSYLPL